MEVFKTQKLGKSGAALKIGTVWIDSESEGVIELGEGPEIEEAVEHFIKMGFLSFDEPEPSVVEEVVEAAEEVEGKPAPVGAPVVEEAPKPKKKRGRKKKKSTGSK